MLADVTFLNRLKSIYPKNTPNPWYIIAAVGFCASNRPEAVPDVFQHALKELQSSMESGGDTGAKQLLLARKFREALFKAGLTCGYARTINALVSLHNVMPQELRDFSPMRRTNTTIEEHNKAGYSLYCDIYGKTAGPTLELLQAVSPDMAWFSTTIGYGAVYSLQEILSANETAYAMIASLIASDVPRQIGWHLAGARRLGATVEEVTAVRKMSMEVATRAGIQWREGVPDLENIDL